jgi:hypothetical protein
MINGVSNNNNINPGGIGAEEERGAASGEAQMLFIDTNLIESVTTYTENIGAEYGGFTGGVVNAKLKDARMDRWHIMTNFRYTKDSWAKFHLTDEQKNINQSTNANFQPEFNKHEYTVSLDGPINENLGLLLSYSNQHSKIPRYSNYDMNISAGQTGKERLTEYRDNKNYLIRLNTHGIDDFEASLTAIYALYTHSDFTRARNSDRDIITGGYNIAYDMKNTLSFGTLKNTLAYKSDEQTVDGSTNYYYSWANSDTKNWFVGSVMNANEGNRGDRELTKDSLIYKSVLELDEIETGSFTHLIKTGVEAEFGKVRYKRETATSFLGGNFNSSVTGSVEDGIIEGEQWTESTLIHEAFDNKKSYTTAALFLEDTIKYDRYTFRPGLRFSTDTVTNNKDIAPRFFANTDIFDDEVWNIYGGYNRYYGGLVLYNSIYAYEINRYERTQVNPSDWTFNYGVKDSASLDGIKTPYSDEFSIGSSLAKWGTLFKLDFVKRKYKDQLTQRVHQDADANRYYTDTNEGQTDYWGLTLSASKEYEFKNTKHFSEFSITRSDKKSNTDGLDYTFSLWTDIDGASDKYVTYDGKITDIKDMPNVNFNSPFVITYSHIMELSDYLRFGLNARYEKGINAYRYVDWSGGLTAPDGKTTYVYESKNYKDIFTVDLSANYDLKFKGNKLTFGVEVLNLLNRKNDADYSSSNSFVENYAMGRQFYANFRYEY